MPATPHTLTRIENTRWPMLTAHLNIKLIPDRLESIMLKLPMPVSMLARATVKQCEWIKFLTICSQCVSFIFNLEELNSFLLISSYHFFSKWPTSRY